MPSFSQWSTTSSCLRSCRLNSFWTAAIGSVWRASSIWSTVTSDRPTCSMRPAFTYSASSSIVSAIGTSEWRRWT